MALAESGEMYLESIYILSKKQEQVHSIHVAEYMGYSKPSVSRAVNLLKSMELLTMDEEGHLSLTEEGQKIAEDIYMRHLVLSRFLEELGVDPVTAADDACKIEHVISDASFEAIKNRK